MYTLPSIQTHLCSLPTDFTCTFHVHVTCVFTQTCRFILRKMAPTLSICHGVCRLYTLVYNRLGCEYLCAVWNAETLNFVRPVDTAAFNLNTIGVLEMASCTFPSSVPRRRQASAWKSGNSCKDLFALTSPRHLACALSPEDGWLGLSCDNLTCPLEMSAARGLSLSPSLAWRSWPHPFASHHHAALCERRPGPPRPPSGRCQSSALDWLSAGRPPAGLWRFRHEGPHCASLTAPTPRPDRDDWSSAHRTHTSVHARAYSAGLRAIGECVRQPSWSAHPS